MRSVLLPYYRFGRLYVQRAQTRLRCAFPHRASQRRPVHFIIGCGRSGTTILGRLLEANDEVRYIYEPYHKWYIVDSRMDVTGLHKDSSDNRFILDAKDVTDQARERFDLLFARLAQADQQQCIIEKTPHNAGRIGWIDEVNPDARYIHIVRNGLDVVRSIDRIATESSYRYAFRSGYNQWWGESGAKWKALSRDGAARGYFGDEVDQLKTNTQRAAYEWLVSLCEVDRYREQLGNRLLEITYHQLIEEPAETCKQISDHLGCRATESWLMGVQEKIRKPRQSQGYHLDLPQKIAQKVNEFQSRYGFEGRVVPIELCEQPPRIEGGTE